jgi:hypothetical protein
LPVPHNAHPVAIGPYIVRDDCRHSTEGEAPKCFFAAARHLDLPILGVEVALEDSVILTHMTD